MLSPTDDIPADALTMAYEKFMNGVVTVCTEQPESIPSFFILTYAHAELMILQQTHEASGVQQDNPVWQHLFKAILGIESALEWVQLHETFDPKIDTEIPSSNNNKSQWTGSMVELVEFAYASLECKSFNHGRITVKDLISDLCECFGCNVKDAYRAFDDIKRRTGDRTIYLDKLKTNLMSKLEQSDREHAQRKRP